MKGISCYLTNFTYISMYFLRKEMTLPRNLLLDFGLAVGRLHAFLPVLLTSLPLLLFGLFRIRRCSPPLLPGLGEDVQGLVQQYLGGGVGGAERRGVCALSSQTRVYLVQAAWFKGELIHQWLLFRYPGSIIAWTWRHYAATERFIYYSANLYCICFSTCFMCTQADALHICGNIRSILYEKFCFNSID